MRHKKISVKNHSTRMKFDARQKMIDQIESESVLHGRDAMICMYGNRHLHIENYIKVLSYTSEEIMIKDRCKKIRIQGERLLIRYFFNGDIDISGVIKAVIFEGLYR